MGQDESNPHGGPWVLAMPCEGGRLAIDEKIVWAVIKAGKVWLVRPGVQRRIDALVDALEDLLDAEKEARNAKDK
jgi:hypothetical protein